MRSVLRAVRFSLRLAGRTDRRRLIGAATLLLLGFLATPAVALLLRALVNTAGAGEATAATWLALAVAAALVVELTMGHFAHILYFEAGELSEAVLHEELLGITNGAPGLAHLDDPGFADTLALVTEDLARTRAALEASLQLLGLGVQAGVTVVILATLDPWLALLPLAALVPVLTGRRSQALLDRAKETAAEDTRLSRHLLALSTSPATVPELRVHRARQALLDLQTDAFDRAGSVLVRSQLRAATLRALGQLVFGAAYGGAILLVAGHALAGQSSVGDVILLITLAVQVAAQISNALGLFATLQNAGRTVTRLAELREAAPALPSVPSDAGPGAPVPPVLADGIRFENVGFRYPGGPPVLSGLDLHLAAGTTVALVGENGAGKSTLVKLLCGMYQPTEGRILVDGEDLRTLSPAAWSARIAPLFQDFARLELLLREQVGVGDLTALDDDAAIGRAVSDAHADNALRRVPGGLDGLLGRGYGDGAELSGGQWQSLALARTLLRPDPLLLLLDEPASALDASAEHALFARFTDAARRAHDASGAVTVFVSHRLSTVRLADRIVFLRDGRVLESGDHRALMAADGAYAELYGLQARAYI
ncbi:ATP-binding cassette domain-containing protein [Streptomyces sp. NPDC014894]|uniref:ATP-binding cassette domain-containing protein n=1 Tax=Streptomyces sp. NPDC014894 TaxID=3364931 RepID=UPI003700B8D3